jgi:phosphoenolpyruvate carboxylase
MSRTSERTSAGALRERGGEDPHKALRDDVRLLGKLLGEVLVRQEGPALYDRVERVRAWAKRARRGGDGAAAAFDALAAELAAMPVEAAVPVARAFAQFLHLANVAEQYHRIRRRRAHQRDASSRPQPGSIEEALPRLAAHATPGRLADAVGSLGIELVVTAHPTEMMRRTLQRKYAAVADALAGLDRTDATPGERQQLIDTLTREITAAWETEEVRRERPSPTDEARAAFAVFERTLWQAVPEYMRALDRTLWETTGSRLPLDAAPIRFGSWIGGDRDGNPSITPEVTRRACLGSRWIALTLYAREVAALCEDLSMTDASETLRACAPAAAEPYRALLRRVHRDLEATRRAIEDQLSTRPGGRGGPRAGEVFQTAADLARPLQLCYDSLHETGNGLIADGALADLLRRLACFGLVLARLDIRQEAQRHTEAVDLIARHAGRPGYAAWSEAERIAFLVEALAEGAPAGTLPNNPRAADVVQTFEMLAAIPRDSLGAYVITMASRASDVLEVEYLQRRAGVSPPLRVVPLFETARDLRAAGDVVDRLLSIEWYRARIAAAGDRQEVMIGYSDSAKEIGRVAAAWDLYQAQDAVMAAGRRHGVAITLFHGRGGSIGRGGGPTWLALQSQPPGSIDGTLRVTEQGEMIQAKFGLPGIALRTLEVYTTATLEAMLTPGAPVRAEWRSAMDRLASAAHHAYREIVYEDGRFLRYFRAVTPEAELDSLHIGSRPTRRGGADVTGLRAIPWQFAWMQTRLLLASWLGAETLGEMDDRAAVLERRREMYREWPFFRSLIELLEMALGKADARIAAEYDRRLAPADLQPFAASLRARLQTATAAVLAITSQTALLADNDVLRRSIEVRNPYVDPINLFQIELLRRLAAIRDGPPIDDAREAEAAVLRHALRITIGGVAAGMRNTG